jgi:hypothetical protein
MENRESGWKKDRLGVIAPIGSGASWKEFFTISKDQSASVANMLTRADLPEDSWQWAFISTSLATYKDEHGQLIIDPEHKVAVANVCGASVGRDGKGRKQALMAQTQIIAPNVLAGDNGDRRRRDRSKLDREQSRQQGNEDSE